MTHPKKKKTEFDQEKDASQWNKYESL